MNRTITRKQFLKKLGWTGAALAVPGLALAQTYPNRPIRLVVPYAPGGNTDLVARLLSQGMTDALGQPVVVENIPGANGVIASNRVASSASDGYTLLFGTAGTQAINLSLYKNLSEKNLDDFEYVALVTSIPNVLVVNEARTPVQSVAQFIEFARKQGRGLNFGSPGSGSTIHLSGEMFKQATKLDLVHVPYKGSAPALTDLMGGQIDFIFENVTPALPFIQANKLKALAVTSDKRLPILPNVPTMKESGYPDFVMGTWNGVLAPKGVPAPILKALEAATLKAASSADYQDKVAALGGETRQLGAAAFRAFTKTEFDRWAAVIRSAQLERL